MAAIEKLTVTGASGPINITGNGTIVHVTETGQVNAQQSGKVLPTGISLSGNKTKIVVDDGGEIIAARDGIRTFGMGDRIEMNDRRDPRVMPAMVAAFDVSAGVVGSLCRPPALAAGTKRC